MPTQGLRNIADSDHLFTQSGAWTVADDFDGITGVFPSQYLLASGYSINYPLAFFARNYLAGSAGASVGMVSSADQASDADYIWLRVNSGDLQLNRRDAGVGVAVASAGTAPINRYYAAGINANTNVGVCYLDGIPGSVDTTAISPSNQTRFGVNALARSTTVATGNRLSIALAWSRTLEDAEHKELATNCWQVFRPRMRRMYFAASAAAAFNAAWNQAANTTISSGARIA